MFLSIEVNDNEPSLSGVGSLGAGGQGGILPENIREYKEKETIYSCCWPLQIFQPFYPSESDDDHTKYLNFTWPRILALCSLPPRNHLSFDSTT